MVLLRFPVRTYCVFISLLIYIYGFGRQTLLKTTWGNGFLKVIYMIKILLVVGAKHQPQSALPVMKVAL